MSTIDTFQFGLLFPCFTFCSKVIESQVDGMCGLTVTSWGNPAGWHEWLQIVTSYIPWRLDYCNYLVIGTPNSAIRPHQKILNFAARLVLLAPRHHHSTLLLEKLHWLLIWKRIQYKVACMCFNAINASGPAYLSELLRVYTPSRTLHSSSDTRMMKIQQYKLKTQQLSHLLWLWIPHLEFTPTRP